MKSQHALASKLLSTDALRQELARRSLDDFARYVRGLEPARHHSYVNQKLEAVERGEIKRLMLFEPPGHAKSTYASVLFPAWYRGRHPDHHLIQASNVVDLAVSFGRKVRNLLAVSEWPWPDVRVSEDAKASGAWAVVQGGEYFAIGTGGTVTGRRAHGAIIDDPVRGREDADSEAVRESPWQWYLSDLRTRLLPDAWLIAIGTRWHEDDLFGRLLPADYAGESGPIMCRDGEVWEVVNLPALAEANDPLGRQPGEALWPDFFTSSKLEVERVAQGPRNWSALFQQRPAPESGDFFQRDWIRYYDDAPPRNTLRVYGSSDYAVTADGGDYTVHVVAGIDPNDDLYLLDLWRGQASTDVWIDAFLDLAEKWGPHVWAEEDGQIIKSVGPFIDKRQRERGVYIWRHQYTSSRDKPSRARPIQGRMAMGKVYFPRRAPWASGLVSEMLKFPTGKHDDQVDALALLGRILDRMGSGDRPKPAPDHTIRPMTWTVPDLKRTLRDRRPPRL
jgi:predicted phage terminase large subunit-like protein